MVLYRQPSQREHVQRALEERQAVFFLMEGTGNANGIHISRAERLEPH